MLMFGESKRRERNTLLFHQFLQLQNWLCMEQVYSIILKVNKKIVLSVIDYIRIYKALLEKKWGSWVLALSLSSICIRNNPLDAFFI